MIVDALVFVVLGMIVGFCMADALHRFRRGFARGVERGAALSLTGEHPYIVLPDDATREDVDAAQERIRVVFPGVRATPVGDMAIGGRNPWPRTDGSEMDAYLDRQRGNPRMMGN